MAKAQENRVKEMIGKQRHGMNSVRRKNRRIGCPPDSVKLAMRFKMKGIQEPSNTTTRIQCHEINFKIN